MKITCISDTHGLHRDFLSMGSGDVIVISGDITMNGEITVVASFLNWLEYLDYSHKIVIAGNHDWCFCNYNKSLIMDEFKSRNIIYLEDSEIIIDDIKFYGSPWQPEFCDWAFNLPRGPRLLNKWLCIPDDTDILITHCPPNGIMDFSIYDEIDCGCEDLRNEIFNRIKPKLHVFGHIHNWYGIEEYDDITFVNASSVNEKYDLVNAPITVEI